MTIIKKQKALIFYLFLSILACIPSIHFFVSKLSFVVLEHPIGYYPLLNTISKQSTQHLIATIFIVILSIFYIKIYNSELLTKSKDIMKWTILISILFWVIIPVTSTDTFYYVSVGRLMSYNINPYVESMKEFVENGNQHLLTTDSLINLGYNNYWNFMLVVYGPLFTALCSVISFISAGNEFIAVYLYKFFVLLVHIANTYLIFKNTQNKKLMLAYGINPFVLFQYIANGHNDIFILFFMLLAIYYLKEKHNLYKCVFFLTLASGIKFITILFLPFLVLYSCQKETFSKRILICINSGIIFILIFLLCFIPFASDYTVFYKFLLQREIYSCSIYSIFRSFLGAEMTTIIKDVYFILFFIGFIITCFYFLFKKEISWSLTRNTCLIIGLIFMLIVLTNLKPWYIIWIIPFLFESKNLKLILIESSILELIHLLSNDTSLRFPILLLINIFIYSVVLIVWKKLNKNFISYYNKRKKI